MKVIRLYIAFEDMKEGDIVEGQYGNIYFIEEIKRCKCSCSCKRIKNMGVMTLDCMNYETFREENGAFKGKRKVIRIIGGK